MFKNPELCHLRDTYLKAITFLGRKNVITDSVCSDLVNTVFSNTKHEWLWVENGIKHVHEVNTATIHDLLEESDDVPLAIVNPLIADDLMKYDYVSKYICLTVPIVTADVFDPKSGSEVFATERTFIQRKNVYEPIQLLTSCVIQNGFVLTTYTY